MRTPEQSTQGFLNQLVMADYMIILGTVIIIALIWIDFKSKEGLIMAIAGAFAFIITYMFDRNNDNELDDIL